MIVSAGKKNVSVMIDKETGEIVQREEKKRGEAQQQGGKKGPCSLCRATKFLRVSGLTQGKRRGSLGWAL
jgi:hypothetical protein